MKGAELLTKLPFLFVATTNPGARPPEPAQIPSRPQGVAFLQANAERGQETSGADPLAGIWKEASASQRKHIAGQSSRSIINNRLVVEQGLNQTAEDLLSRTRGLGFDDRLILIPITGKPTKDQVAIGPLAKAFVMKHFEDKYDITIGSAVVVENEDTGEKDFAYGEGSLDKMVSRLQGGEQVGVIVTDKKFEHSATIIMKLDKENDTLNGISMEGIPMGVVANDLDYETVVEMIADEMGADSRFTSASKIFRQEDESSCNTEACIIARDMLIDKDSNIAIEIRTGDKAPVATFKTAQRESFLEREGYNPDMVYSEAKNRTLQEHRDDHTIEVDGKDAFLYLRAKSLQYANSTLNWLESLPDRETAQDAADALLTGAYKDTMLDDIPDLLDREYN